MWRADQGSAPPIRRHSSCWPCSGGIRRNRLPHQNAIHCADVLEARTSIVAASGAVCDAVGCATRVGFNGALPLRTKATRWNCWPRRGSWGDVAEEIVLGGVEPAHIATGIGLSPQVEAALPPAMGRARGGVGRGLRWSEG